MMEEEVVRRRRWVTHEQFLDLLGATNLIPGPNSTEMAIHLGLVRAGWTGLLVAGACFILPAALIVTAIAWAYVRYGALPQVVAILHGVKPVIIAVVLQALWGLGRTALKTRLLWGVGAAAILLAALGVNELAVLFGAGTFVSGARWVAAERKAGVRPLVGLLAVGILLSLPVLLATRHAAVTAVGPGPLFLFFLKVGAVLYGSGYVLLAFLRDDLVDRWHWLSSAQLLDAVAVGQVTPGPVFTTATFLGYLLAGPLGALVATLGIFLPAFFFVAVSGPLVPRLRKSPMAGAFLDGVNVASLALMAVVTWQLGRAALVDPLTVALAIASGVLLVRFRVNSAWLVLAGVLVGLLASVLR
jgi:chromate transporter